MEDLTATLVKKGQSVDKTTEAFRRLRDAGICPMPMMMHHDSQPLYSPGSDYGLLNQLRLLRKAGAVSIQVLMLVPAPGTKLYNGTYTSGQVFDRVGGRRVDPYMHDGNYVIASHHKQPWRKQFNILAGYLYFYNLLWLLAAVFRKKTKVGDKPISMQLLGIVGVAHNIYRTLGWALRLKFRKIERLTQPPTSTIPMRSVGGGTASHDRSAVSLTIERSALPDRAGQNRSRKPVQQLAERTPGP